MYEYLFSVFALMLAIPVAYILAKMTKEELRKRKKFFVAFMIFFATAALISLAIRFENWQAVLFTMLFMSLVELGLLMFSKK